MRHKNRIKKKQEKKEKGIKQQPIASVAPEPKEKTVKLPKGTSVAKVVAASKAQYENMSDEEVVAVPKKNGKYTMAGLADCWRRAHGKYGTGTLPVITGKQQGQLRNAYLKVGDHVPQLILAVIKDWPGFVAMVKSETSAYNHPTKPDIGYFSQHAVTAMNYVLAKETAEANPELPTLAEKKLAPKPPVQPIAKKAPTKQSPGKVSIADIEDVFANL